MLKRKSTIGCLTAIGSIAVLAGMQVDPKATDFAGGPEIDGDGPDMQFCQLYDLRQFGRVGDVVGLALATTSWNTGNADLMWFASPDNRHPFIVPNLYRLKNDRFEQIGQGWVKHGFYALGNTQCGGQCEYEPGHFTGDWLGQNCTDTYSASLNASQGGLGPRSEINPWTGYWSYQGSNFQRGIRPEDSVDRLCQVYDADLDPAQNQGAEYFAEGYYAILDDINLLNSASWKPVTPNGQPGGNWTFGMSGSGTRPTDGFALATGAWPGARITMFAQEIPVIEFESPDGRSFLGAKVTDNGDGTWHYEYALLNADMDRKVGSFTVPLPEGTDVTNIDFHAVESRNEGYPNTEWTVDLQSNSITWSTDDNPIRWGTMYNFRFDADKGPDDGEIILGHFEPGTPEFVTGLSWAPGNRALALSIEGQCPGQMTASISGGAPGTVVAVAYATGRGTTEIPGGPCAGTVLDLNGTARQIGPILRFDANGEASITQFDVPAQACGGFLQAVAGDGCGTSNVVEVD